MIESLKNANDQSEKSIQNHKDRIITLKNQIADYEEKEKENKLLLV